MSNRKVISGIYLIHNNITGEEYVGQSKDIFDRWRRYPSEHNGRDITLAIEKYGIENFNFSIIDKCEECMLNEREIFWIEEKDTYYNGYNMTKGGETGIKSKMKPVIMYDLDGNFIKSYESLSEASRDTLVDNSQITRICNGVNYTSNGRVFRFEGDDFNKYEVIPPRPKNMVSVSQYDLDGNFIKSYDSIKDAARETNINKTGIRKTCLKMQASTKGYIFKFNNDYNILSKKNYKSKPIIIKNVNGYIEKFNSIKQATISKSVSQGTVKRWIEDGDIHNGYYWYYDTYKPVETRIVQYDKLGNRVNEYSSLDDLFIKTGFRKDFVIKSCNGKVFSSYNYVWRYYPDKFNKFKDEGKYGNRVVVQYDLKNNKLYEYKTCMDAYRSTGISNSNISRACNSKNHKSSGFIWKYEYID